MNIGIIGVGKVGGGLGKLRVRATHQVFFLVRVIQTDGEHLSNSNKQAQELNPRPLQRKEFLFESCDCGP
jgi:predicted dinucleotide-binding enzyme